MKGCVRCGHTLAIYVRCSPLAGATAYKQQHAVAHIEDALHFPTEIAMFLYLSF